jgi:hypothetical protein
LALTRNFFNSLAASLVHGTATANAPVMATTQQTRIEQTIIKGVTVQVIVISDDEDDRAPNTRTTQAGSDAPHTATTATTAAATSRPRVRFDNEESHRDDDSRVTSVAHIAHRLGRSKHGHAATQAGSAAATAAATLLRTRLHDEEDSHGQPHNHDDDDEEWVPARKIARGRKTNSANAFEARWDALWKEEITRTQEVVPQAARDNTATHGPRIVPMTATPRTFVFKLK